MLRKISLCLVSSALLILSFPNFNLWPFAWFGFVPLFYALRDKTKTQAFLLSYLTGLIFWLGTVYWLVHVTLPGMIILVLYLALYFAVFGLFFSYCASRAPQTANLLTIPSAWVLLEYIRSHLLTGFPWLLLAYSQHLNLPVIQIADITGAWGVSFLIMMVNVAIFRKKLKHGIVAAVVVLIVIGYGYYKLYRTPRAAHRAPLCVSVVQANIPQELKWDPASQRPIMDKYLALTQIATGDKPDLIIWPEAALPVVLEEEPLFFEEVREFMRKAETPLLLGAVTTRDNAYHNSAVLVSGQGQVLKQYDKLHLVPFGEYIPLRNIFTFLETVVPIGDFLAGSEYTVFEIRNPKSEIRNKFATLICFEDVFPELARGFAWRGADFLVNITNDAWFAKTAAPYQHFSAAVFRAIENRLPLVRCANTGVSGFIDPQGKILSLVRDASGEKIFISGYKTQEMDIPKDTPAPYTIYGDIFILPCVLLALYGIMRPLCAKF